MRKNLVQNVVIHTADETDGQPLATQINEFHVALIERSLNQSQLTLAQKKAVLDQIITDLKSQVGQGGLQ